MQIFLSEKGDPKDNLPCKECSIGVTSIGAKRPWPRHNQGLSLIEILVALVIASLLFYVSVSTPGSSERDNLDRAMDTMEKIINFSINESILRNRITRAHFDLTNEIPLIKVEFNSDTQFVLPDLKQYDEENLGIEEREAKERLIKKVNSKFKSIEDVDPENLKIPEQIQILGIATSLRPSLIADDETSIYVYPSGERDSALIVFAAFDQIAALTIEPYTGEFIREYVTIAIENELEEEYEEVVEEFLANWSQ